MNKMSENDCYEAIESCIEHPNLEILQFAEKLKDNKLDANKKGN